MLDDVQAGEEHRERLHDGKVKPSLLKRFWSVFGSWIIILFLISSGFIFGFNFRGTLDDRLINTLKEAHYECIGIVKGLAMPRQGDIIVDEKVDKKIHVI